MQRRVHVPNLATGRLTLGRAESHHLRDVLRSAVGDDLQVFDSTGHSAAATIVQLNVDTVVVDVGRIETSASKVHLTIAAAVPKADRADWMIEKLCELGVSAFVPLEAARSVVLPTGRGKAERWQRIAIEAAKQSRRNGVMTIAPLTKLADALQTAGDGACVASTVPGVSRLTELPSRSALTIFIGPEGGWTDVERGLFSSVAAHEFSLTETILRIETAAMTAAAIVLCR